MESLVREAFETGSGLSTVILFQLFNVIVVGVLVLWTAWTAIGTFQLWTGGQATFLQFITTLFRALVVMLLLFYIL